MLQQCRWWQCETYKHPKIRKNDRLAIRNIKNIIFKKHQKKKTTKERRKQWLVWIINSYPAAVCKDCALDAPGAGGEGWSGGGGTTGVGGAKGANSPAKMKVNFKKKKRSYHYYSS